MAVQQTDCLPDYLTADELAAAAGISPSTVWRLKRAGKIPYHQPGGGRCFVRFPRTAIELSHSQSRRSETANGMIDVTAQVKLLPRPNFELRSHLSGAQPKWMR